MAGTNWNVIQMEKNNLSHCWCGEAMQYYDEDVVKKA
jgi:hypothetical protein